MVDGALKAQMSVVAGVIPGEPIETFTRVWQFTSDQIEAARHAEDNHAYNDAMGAALHYAASLQNPGRVNWVKLEWMWM